MLKKKVQVATILGQQLARPPLKLYSCRKSSKIQNTFLLHDLFCQRLLNCHTSERWNFIMYAVYCTLYTVYLLRRLQSEAREQFLMYTCNTEIVVIIYNGWGGPLTNGAERVLSVLLCEGLGWGQLKGFMCPPCWGRLEEVARYAPARKTTIALSKMTLALQWQFHLKDVYCNVSCILSSVNCLLSTNYCLLTTVYCHKHTDLCLRKI